VAAAACASDRAVDREPAGGDAFFSAWAEAWSGGDPYDIVRFYDLEVAVESAQPDLELTNPAGFSDTTTEGHGRAWLAEWIAEHTNPRPRRVTSLFIGPASAIAVMAVDSLNTAVVQRMEVDPDGITAQATLRWRDAHKAGGAPDLRLAWVDDLVERYAAVWAEPAPGALTGLYAADAELHGPGSSVRGIDAVKASAAALTLDDAEVVVAAAGNRTGPAVFVVPGRDTRHVVFLVGTAAGGECGVLAVSVNLNTERRIVAERRLAAAGCGSAPTWWRSLEMPLPVEAQVTGSVPHPDGDDIPLINGTPELARLVEWALGRFVAAGIGAPTVESVTFAPVPACRDVAGVVVENDGRTPDLTQCTDAYAACRPDRSSCRRFDRSVRFALLHELAHVWALGYLDDEVREAFLEREGLPVWRSRDVPWHLRGVEQAADTIAWGLMDERIPLTRFGSPECAATAGAFELLTGAAPLQPCE
jgi:hypothetical protein